MAVSPSSNHERAEEADVRDWVERSVELKLETASSASREFAERPMHEKAEQLTEAGRLGIQLLAANPNRERIEQRREAENRDFAKVLAGIRERLR